MVDIQLGSRYASESNISNVSSSYTKTDGTKYSRMDQVKFVENSL